MGDCGCIHINDFKRRKTVWFKRKKWKYVGGYGYEWEGHTEASHTNITVHEAGKRNNPGTGAAGKSHVGLPLLTG
jgi:hypothetical protein